MAATRGMTVWMVVLGLTAAGCITATDEGTDTEPVPRTPSDGPRSTEAPDPQGEEAPGDLDTGSGDAPDESERPTGEPRRGDANGSKGNATRPAATERRECRAPAAPEPSRDERGVKPKLALDVIASGFTQPVGVIAHPVLNDTFLVIEKPGRVLVVENETVRDAPFLDARGDVETGNWEQGLLGLAFHPGFAENGRVFIAFTPPSKEPANSGKRPSDLDESEFEHAVTLAEVTVDPVELAAAWDARTELLTIPKPGPNHNGGTLAFGRDCMLYYGMGEGGVGYHARDPGNLLGSMLRLDVTPNGAYRVPDDNPFVRDEGRGEVWQYGLRNPWKFSVDRVTGDLWIGDVGGSEREEVNVIRDGRAGLDFGWDTYEGTYPLTPRADEDSGSLEGPVWEYGRDRNPDGSWNCAVIGGFVYRGEAIPWLWGHYVYGDLCSGQLHSFTADADDPSAKLLHRGPRGLVAFGETHTGELLVVNHDDGTLAKLAPRS